MATVLAVWQRCALLGALLLASCFLTDRVLGCCLLLAGTDMVLERALVMEAENEILATHRIPAPITPNLE
jgi:hypothetical protein